MARIVFTAAADADAEAIFDHLYEKAGKAIAVKYRASFRSFYNLLAEFPETGAARSGMGRHIRIVSPYIVIYRHSEVDGVVSILRIVHGRRRITGALIRRAT